MSHGGKRSKWIWLLPVLAVPLFVSGYFILPVASAELLFAALFVIFGVLMALCLLVLAAVAYVSKKTVVALISIGRHVRSSIPDFVILPVWPVYHTSLAHRTQGQKSRA